MSDATQVTSGEPAIALEIIQQLAEEIPFLKALSTKVVDLERGRCCLSLPWQEDLVGDRSTGIVHGGVITTLLDSASGMAVFSGYPAGDASCDAGPSD